VVVTPAATTLISGASTSSGSIGRADSLGREAGQRRRWRRREIVLLERKFFFRPLVRTELIFGGVIVGADGDAVSTSPAESESGGGGRYMPSGASRAKCNLLCEIVVLVDVSSVAGGRDLLDISGCWCSTGSRIASPKISRSCFLDFFFPFWRRTGIKHSLLVRRLCAWRW